MITADNREWTEATDSRSYKYIGDAVFCQEHPDKWLNRHERRKKAAIKRKRK